jgi:hypothetical protein
MSQTTHYGKKANDVLWEKTSRLAGLLRDGLRCGVCVQLAEDRLYRPFDHDGFNLIERGRWVLPCLGPGDLLTSQADTKGDFSGNWLLTF